MKIQKETIVSFEYRPHQTREAADKGETSSRRKPEGDAMWPPLPGFGGKENIVPPGTGGPGHWNE
jgi:hypothetical protein